MNKKLSKEAYGGVAGKDYVPYISSGSRIGGNTAVLIIGILLAALFGASTAYSGMKAGLTVAAGIPGSILGSVFIAIFAKEKGILGKTLIQGMSSGGESIASGMIFVLPAVLLIGTKISFLEGFVVGVGGALFGLACTTLVYNYLIVQEHGKLMYPESMAISETLVASEGAKDSIRFMGIGFGIGGVLTVFTSSFLNVCNNVVSFVNETFYKWKFQIEVNPLLVGIGFIVGLPVALCMFAGSILANFVVIPLIGYFAALGQGAAAVWNNPSVAISAMTVGDISGSYVKYIGAGIMLSGGLISAIKLIPTVASSIRETRNAKSGGKGGNLEKFLMIGGVVICFIGGFMVSGGNIAMAILASVVSMLLSLLFTIVSGRLTGTIGTSNLPVSGMTIASIVVVTLLFVGMGWTTNLDNKALLMFGTFIVTAIAAAGGYCQSQKVSYVIGGQKAEMDKYFTIACVVGVAVVTGVILLLAPQLSMTGDNVPFALPQANLMATLTSGIMSGKLPWVMIIAGAVLGIVFYLLGLPVMTAAIGFYLPISTTSIILLGALIRVLVEKLCKSDAERDSRVSNGISLSSGLVAGGSIIGLIGIILQVTGVISGTAPTGFAAGNGMAFLMLIALVVLTILPIMKVNTKHAE
ncbi:MAG: oligopeptide transporter, OPT family [Oscillibacter sp.]|jgi:putative OPT family oligopeptide transporter|nr:oligopeptide transporter, OPT family [Oscillibacter sp.]